MHLGYLIYMIIIQLSKQALKHLLKCPTSEDGQAIELAIETVNFGFIAIFAVCFPWVYEIYIYVYIYLNHQLVVLFMNVYYVII